MKKKTEEKTHEERLESFFKVEGDLLDRFMQRLKKKGKMKLRTGPRSHLYR